MSCFLCNVLVVSYVRWCMTLRAIQWWQQMRLFYQSILLRAVLWIWRISKSPSQFCGWCAPMGSWRR
ncbi:hypothetical protein DM558_02190 [Entomomonas moraniae]|uniref:Uncharacterized protein n=1 Tax=Entomomonas moraniae TaxID=2213226 RepID=A0A3S9XBC1_9GAMM|nr:hypothetical protein DM558_02190 [Entomomonas moraniae]